MTHSVLLLAGRVLIALLFVLFGWQKLLNFGGTAAYFGRLGMPLPQAMAAIAIAVELGGGVLLMAGWKTRWVALGMALFTAVAAVLGHPYWSADAAQLFSQTSHFYKNVSIIGGMLVLAAAGPGRYSFDRR